MIAIVPVILDTQAQAQDIRNPWHMNTVPFKYLQPRETSKGKETTHFKNQSTPQSLWDFQENSLPEIHTRLLQHLELMQNIGGGAVARNNQKKDATFQLVPESKRLIPNTDKRNSSSVVTFAMEEKKKVS